MSNFVKRDLAYLAGPYSSPNQSVMDEREISHSKCAVWLKGQGESIYAPIPETTSLARFGGLKGTSWNDWRDHDLNLLSRCDKLYVMLIPGWKESIGVRGEVKFALQNNIPIEFLSVEEDGSVTAKIITNALEMFEVEEISELND